MCGRYVIATEEESIQMRAILDEINERYQSTPGSPAVKTGEIFPTDTAPVLVRGEGQPQAVAMKWGFPKPPPPRDAGAPARQGGVIINARAETAADKPMFRAALASQRCVVPATGFFEWRQESGNKKTKYLFRLPDTNMLYLAGLYRVFRGGADAHSAYVILTTDANASVSPYHNRMPLVLLPDEVHPWLTDAAFAHAHVQHPCRAMLEAAAVL